MMKHHFTLRRGAQTQHQKAFGFSIWNVDEPAVMSVAHTHPDIELNWIERGWIEYSIAGRRVRCASGRLAVFWGGVPHQLTDTADGTRGTWLTLPLAWLLQCQLPTSLTADLMGHELLSLTMPRERVRQWTHDFTQGSTGHRATLLELEAIFIRLAGVKKCLVEASSRREMTTGRSKLTIDHAERAITYMVQHYAKPVDVPEIASAVGLHPKYLMSVFKFACGVSVKTYLLRLRLAHAQRLLVATKRSVLTIAHESGFGSTSRFYAAFGRHVGERPAHYRRRHSDWEPRSERD